MSEQYTCRYVCMECGAEFCSLGPVTGCSVCGGRNLLEWEEAQRRIQVIERDMQRRDRADNDWSEYHDSQ